MAFSGGIVVAIAVVAALTALSGLWVAHDLPGRCLRTLVDVEPKERQTA